MLSYKATKFPVCEPDIIAEIASAEVRGETITRRDAIQRIRDRHDEERRELGWFEALRRQRERRAVHGE